MAKKIKILVITFSFPTNVNQAAGVFILNQLEYLKKDYDIKVLNPYPYVPPFRFLKSYKFSQVPFKESIKGMEVYRPKYFMFPRNRLTYFFINIIFVLEGVMSEICSRGVVRSLAKNWDFDIIHSHGFVPDSLIAASIKKKYSKPFVVTVHGEDVTKYSKMLFLKHLSKDALSRCDRIISVSKSLKDDIYKLDLTKKPIEVIPSGYNVRRFKPLDMKKCRRILHLPENKKIVLFVGHLIERKGIEYLIKAVKILSEKDEGILCCIVGTGISENKLKNIVSELNLKNKIIFTGQKNPDELPIWMNACDVLVLPSLNEGLPNVISEVLACGKPVVATNVAGTPEILNKDVGYLVKPKDEEDLAKKIRMTLSKRFDKEKLLKRANEFSVTSSVKKLAKIYEECLNQTD